MTILTHDAASKATGYCVYTVAEAAKKLNRSESAVRRELRTAGVKRVAGPTVAAFASWAFAHGSLDVRLPVHEMQS